MSIDKDRKKKEDEYFARVEFERRKQKLAEAHKEIKQAEKEELKDLHWMRCPKCGMEMIEVDFEGVKVDKCSECLGVFFDDGEVEHVIAKNKPGFLSRLAGAFKE